MNSNFCINGKIIETKRLILRSFVSGDLDDFYEYASVEGVGEMAGWKHHGSKEETLKILNLFIEHDKTFAICLKESRKLIGSLGIERYREDEVSGELDRYYGRELGFVLSKKYWGTGIMPEAVNAVIAYLFDDLKLDFLTCSYYGFNSRSKRVQEKCGFKPYRNLISETKLETKERSVLNILVNKKGRIKSDFPQP